MQKVWGLVLSLFGVFILRIPSRQCLGFGTLGGIVSKISSGGGLGLGYGRVSRAITSWAILIHLSEDGKRLEAINRFLPYYSISWP